MGRSQKLKPVRERGSIDELPSGALRVRVYAGVDSVTKRRHDLVKVIPAGPKAKQQARAARDRLVSQVEERRNLRMNATPDQLLDRYLDQFDEAHRAQEIVRDQGIVLGDAGDRVKGPPRDRGEAGGGPPLLSSSGGPFSVAGPSSALLQCGPRRHGGGPGGG